MSLLQKCQISVWFVFPLLFSKRVSPIEEVSSYSAEEVGREVSPALSFDSRYLWVGLYEFHIMP